MSLGNYSIVQIDWAGRQKGREGAIHTDVATAALCESPGHRYSSIAGTGDVFAGGLGYKQEM